MQIACRSLTLLMLKGSLLSTWLQDIKNGSLGGFVVDWDSSQSQDVVLRRKCDTGEEVAVSALLGPVHFGRETDEDVYPRDVLMKICVKKPGLKSMLQFDCEVYKTGSNGSEFNIHNAHYLQSSAGVSRSIYRGPLFR